MSLIIYTDGGSRGNPGPAAFGFVIYEDDKKLVEIGKKIGITTNNVAEYSAVLESLVWVSKHVLGVPESIDYYLDSQLIARQMSGIYKMKSPHLAKIFSKINRLAKDMNTSLSFTHIPREHNKEADRMVNLALDHKLEQ